MSRANPRFRKPQLPLPAPAANVYQATVFGLNQGRTWNTTLYYIDNQPLHTNPNPAACATAVTSNFSTWQPILSNTDATVGGVNVRVLSDATTLSVFRPLATPLAGTVVSKSDGTVQTAVIRRYTSFRGSCGRGQVRLPAVPATFMLADGATLSAAAVTAYGTWATANLFTVLLSGGVNFTPAVVSRGTRLARGVLGVSPITTTVIDTVTGTVRKRKLGSV